MYRRIIKRTLDIMFALLLMIVFSFPMVVILGVVKFTSAGPTIFKQRRYGLNSREFNLYKIRTMKIGTPLLANKEIEVADSYLTPIGGFLRRTSIDEIPQLINIIKGDMSFLGPRPMAESDMQVVNLRRKYGADLVRPGISGLAQINGRNHLTDEAKVRYDLKYVQNVSMRTDLQILAITLVNVFLRKDINANE